MWGAGADGLPKDGSGPNPLLQNHILMIIHPPMLYLGYVGMSVPFGIACAGLAALSGVGLAVYIRRCKMRRVDTQMAEHLAALSERGPGAWESGAGA